MLQIRASELKFGPLVCVIFALRNSNVTLNFQRWQKYDPVIDVAQTCVVMVIVTNEDQRLQDISYLRRTIAPHSYNGQSVHRCLHIYNATARACLPLHLNLAM